MEHLTTNEVSLLVAAAGVIGGLVGWLGRGLSFILTRWWTGSPKQERAAYLNTVAELGAKLRAHGMTIEEVQRLEAIVQNPAIASSDAATNVVQDLAQDEDEPQAFQSNYAMKVRTAAAYNVAEAKLDQAVADLQIIASKAEVEAIAKAQEHWRQYRDSLEAISLCRYEGGSHAVLAMILTGVAETERRTQEIQADVAERASL